MATYLRGFKTRAYRELYEQLSELFDAEPLQRVFSFQERGGDVEAEDFLDTQKNRVSVVFTQWEEGIYYLDFSINGNSFENPKISYTVTEYSTLLSTVASCVSQFLDEYSPKGLILAGADSILKTTKNEKAKGQKNRIYHAFVSRINAGDQNYAVERNKNGDLELIKMAPYRK